LKKDCGAQRNAATDKTKPPQNTEAALFFDSCEVASKEARHRAAMIRDGFKFLKFSQRLFAVPKAPKKEKRRGTEVPRL
jgi:hypothetical protein